MTTLSETCDRIEAALAFAERADFSEFIMAGLVKDYLRTLVELGETQELLALEAGYGALGGFEAHEAGEERFEALKVRVESVHPRLKEARP